MLQLDPRIVRVSIEVNGRLKVYEHLSIEASGVKYANSVQNECDVKITNLDLDTQNYLITETSPNNPNRTPKRVIVEAGRKSYGVSRIYSGNITNAVATTQPDITLSMKCLSGAFLNGNIIARSQPKLANFSDIAQQVATDIGHTLSFNTTDKKIANYNYSGPSGQQVESLAALSGAQVYTDEGVLVIKDRNRALPGSLRLVDINNGMIDKPELNRFGVSVKFYLDNQTVLGGGLRVKSIKNPAANGDYVIYKLSFNIANRKNPFYWIAEASKI